LVVIRSFAAFFAGLALAAAGLSALVPFPQIGALWRKYHHFREHRGEYSLLYIGSSRVFHEFIPGQFDAALAARGHKVKSLNFGQDGMWPPESLYMLRQLLGERSPGLHWVFIDLMGIKPSIDGNETTVRAEYWHDWRHTSLALRHIISVPMEGQRTFGEKADLCWQHFSMWMQHATNAGNGSERLRVALKMDRDKKYVPVLEEGWEPGGNGPLKGEPLALFEQKTALLRAGVPSKPIPPLLREALDDIVAAVRATGAEPVFVVSSGIYGAERFHDWPPPGVKVLAFDDPEKFPALYDPAHRYDPHHLDPVGAREFTRLLAERFAQLLEEKR
jgi:hypothetical protein